MFNTMKIAKQIREARIAKNMTQMNLADAMGVSYQAVSNWERGNSMPDISKLEDLCGALEITVEELLGIQSPQSAAVVKLMETDVPLSTEELVEVAPVLPPEELKKQAQKQKPNLSALVKVAPFLGEEFLTELVQAADVEKLEEIVALAPFLDEDVLDELVRKARETDRAGVLALVPFLEEDTLNWLVGQCDFEKDQKFLEALAPFLEEETIDALAEEQIAAGNLKALEGLYPFMEEETLHKVVKALMAEGDLSGLRKVTQHL